MQIGETGPIPRPVRWALLSLLGSAVLGCAAISIYFGFIDPKPDLAMAALGVTQKSLTGLVVVATVLFSFRMKQTDDIQVMIDNFFIEDIMTALQGVDIAPSPFVRFETAKHFKRTVPRVRNLSVVSTDFTRGRDAAGFRIENAQSSPFEVYIKVNVKHVAIKYFFDPTLFSPDAEEAEFMGYFAQTLAGAQSVGYTVKLVRRYHATKAADVLELSLYFSMGADTLSSAAERLFLRNDLRTMTSSMLHTLNGVRDVKSR